jgi:hypothetical protein
MDKERQSTPRSSEVYFDIVGTPRLDYDTRTETPDP